MLGLVYLSVTDLVKECYAELILHDAHCNFYCFCVFYVYLHIFFRTTWVALFWFRSYTVRNKRFILPAKRFKFALFYTLSEANLNCNAPLASGLLALFICWGISTCTTSMLTTVSFFKHPHFLARCENIFRNFELIRQ